MHRLAFLVLGMMALVCVISAAGRKCHSEEYYLAKRKLQQLVLTSAQKQEIARHDADFNRKWRRTHSEKGCSHHEAHADEFVALATGCLTPRQFRGFHGRTRNLVEDAGWEIRLTGQHIDDLTKLVAAL